MALIKEDRIDDALSTIQVAQKLPVDLSFFKVKIRALVLFHSSQTSFDLKFYDG